MMRFSNGGRGFSNDRAGVPLFFLFAFSGLIESVDSHRDFTRFSRVFARQKPGAGLRFPSSRVAPLIALVDRSGQQTSAKIESGFRGFWS